MHDTIKQAIRTAARIPVPDDAALTFCKMTFTQPNGHLHDITLRMQGASDFAAQLDEARTTSTQLEQLKEALVRLKPGDIRITPDFGETEREGLEQELAEARKRAATFERLYQQSQARARSLKAALTKTQDKLARTRAYNGHHKVSGLSRSLAEMGYPKPRNRDAVSHVLDTVRTLASKQEQAPGRSDIQKAESLGNALTALKTIASMTETIPELNPVTIIAQSAVGRVMRDRATVGLPMREVEVITHSAIGQNIEDALRRRFGSGLEEMTRKHDALHDQITELVKTVERLGWVTPAKIVEQLQDELDEQIRQNP